MAQDYYDLLGVSRTANADEIKKAFRKKAHELHPDKSGGDAEKFKEVNEAYQVLNNPQKRQQYDQFGAAGPTGAGFGSNAGGFGGFNQAQWQNVNLNDFGDIFGDLFGFGRSGRGREANRGQDIEAQLSIPFKVAAFGGSQTIELKHHVTCSHCNGEGAEPGTKTEVCATCQGAGQVRQMQQSFLGPIQSVQTCSTCRGEGRIIKTKCKTCRGEGRELKSETITVKIPAGIDSGQQIRLSGKGEAGQRGTPSGDLYLRVRVATDPDFGRDGQDILTTAKIPLSTAALGGTVNVKTLDGEAKLKIPAGTISGKVFLLKHHGLPNVRGSDKGDQRVTVIIDVPHKLSGRQKKLLQDLQSEGL